MTTNISIVDRVVERLKAAPLGDLITEEDLHDIVKQAIPKVFFEPRIERRPYGSDITHQPLIYDALRQGMQEQVKVAVNNWLAENAEQVRDYWQKVMDEGLMSYVQKMQDEQATGQIRKALSGMIDAINQDRARQGLLPIYL